LSRRPRIYQSCSAIEEEEGEEEEGEEEEGEEEEGEEEEEEDDEEDLPLTTITYFGSFILCCYSQSVQHSVNILATLHVTFTWLVWL